MADALKRVVDGQLCAGCGACTQIADGITMEMQGAGYLRPRANAALTPEQTAVFNDICPGVGLTQQPDGREDHPLWGPLIEVRSGHSTDENVRYNGSSGGGLSGLLIHLLEEGQIDAVIQIAGAELPAYANKTVVSRGKAEIIAAAGSRYNPSAPLEGLDTLLEGSETFAFVGKPCDVAALRGLARHDARIDARIPFMLSFFCAGVPSEVGAKKVVEALGVAQDDLAAFRYRGEGWPGYAKATRHDGSTEKMSYADSWGSILSAHVQFRCKICPDGTGGFADVVCADAWETDEKGYPLFEEGDGTSLIVSRTDKGETLVKAAQAAGRLVTEPFDVDKIAPMQPGQYGKRRYVLARLTSLKVLMRPYTRYTGFHLGYGAKQAPLKMLAKNFLGTLRRVVIGKY